jgi:hypothetical protein
MALTTETKAFPASLPTSTPILDVLRSSASSRMGKLTSGEYFFLSSVLIGLFIAQTQLRSVLVDVSTWDLAVFLLLAPASAFLTAWLVHEAGHYIAAQMARFQIAGFAAQGRSDSQSLDASGALRVGVFLLKPRTTQNLRGRLVAVFLAGPLAGVLLGLAIEMGRDWSQANLLLQVSVHLVAAVSFLFSLATLLPDTGRDGNFSDGARLLMLLRKDAKAARLCAVLEMQSFLQDGVHPRNWPPTLAEHAAEFNDGSRDAVIALWFAYLWASERQDITAATRFLEEALAAPAACPAWLRDRLHLEAAVFQAWFRDNADKARFWAGRIHVGKLSAFEQARLEIALLWVEGRLFDAFEKVPDYFAALRRLPESPGRELREKSALEWKHQMESRMLTRAWRSMYNLSQQVELSAPASMVASTGGELSSC